MVLAVCECVEPTNGRMGMVLARMGMVLAVCECIDLDVVCCRFISRRRKILGSSRVILLVMGTNRTRSLIVFAKLQVPSYYITWYYSYNVCILSSQFLVLSNCFVSWTRFWNCTSWNVKIYLIVVDLRNAKTLDRGYIPIFAKCLTIFHTIY